MKPVFKYSMDGKFIQGYEAVSEAARKEHTGTDGIYKVCRGERLHHIGFRWSYEKKDSLPPLEITAVPNPTGFNGENFTGKPLSLCNYCTNSCGRCSWSKNLIPVEGWKADKVDYSTGTYGLSGVSYMVHECPQFNKIDMGRNKQTWKKTRL